jgi:addiction module HigA family antidote
MTDSLEIVETLPPLHPGEILREDFLTPLGLSALALAKLCGVPRTRIERVAEEKVGVTADTALRLGRVLGTTAQFWMNLQARYDLETAEAAAGDTLNQLARFAMPPRARPKRSTAGGPSRKAAPSAVSR